MSRVIKNNAYSTIAYYSIHLFYSSQAEPTMHQKVFRLFHFLIRNGKASYSHFLEALSATKQQFIRAQLEKEDVET